ncbi:MAG: ribosome small subunit-dependent GTPase A [Verrucomicrobiae bacterium]|nr:ribosome small subunit-dependent GTPase A [Verrucomicrobiae bacterium]
MQPNVFRSGEQPLRGLVVCRAGAKIEVWVPDRERTFDGLLRGKLELQSASIYAGDWVRGNLVSDTELAIEAVEDRKNLLPKPRVANVDKLVVVMSWREPEFSSFTLDALLALAEYFGLPATVVLTKTDLVRKRQQPKFDAWVRLYSGLGYHLICTSTETGAGLDELRTALRGNVVVLAGPSGVGKSSLLNAVIPGASLRVGEVSDKTGRGRHTTTEVRLLPNPNGGWIADTPGFQRVELSQLVGIRELPRLYREFTQVQCQFNDCSHTQEPGCGVRAALESRKIARERYTSYLFWRGRITSAFSK